MKVNIAALLLLLAMACAHHENRYLITFEECQRGHRLESLPRIGDPTPLTPSTSCKTMVSSAQFAPAIEAIVDGVEFTVAFDEASEAVIFVATSDSNFATPEGYSAGDSLARILEETGGTLLGEPGWACFVELASGWYASISIADTQDSFRWVSCESRDVDTTRVTWFFRR